jgi:hypothetical protein
MIMRIRANDEKCLKNAAKSAACMPVAIQAEVAQLRMEQVLNWHGSQVVEAGIQVLQTAACAQAGEAAEPVALEK